MDQGLREAVREWVREFVLAELQALGITARRKKKRIRRRKKT